jgi:hypothetical protein
LGLDGNRHGPVQHLRLDADKKADRESQEDALDDR